MSIFTESVRLKENLLRTGLYWPIHRIYSATIGREATRARNEMRNFFARLLPQNALVFDVGAHVGAFSEALASVGTRVVALEPNMDCAQLLKLMYANKNILVIQAAAGARNGISTLNVSDDWTCTCTLSIDWMARMQAIDERYKRNWLHQTAVPVFTLDTLMEHFGEPYYIKVDVEGYELEVLRGLSKQPPLLSFEFHKTFIEAALQCLNLPLFAQGSMFNAVMNPAWGYPSHFKFGDWLEKEEMRRILTQLPGADDQGDIYVRRQGLGCNF
jgi:FkbM family methyltransferase